MSISDEKHGEGGLRLLSMLTGALSFVGGVATIVSAQEKEIYYGVTISSHVNAFLLYVGLAMIASGLISAFVLWRIAVAFERTARIEAFLSPQEPPPPVLSEA